MAETPRGSVHKSPVRPLQHAPKQTGNEDIVRENSGLRSGPLSARQKFEI